MTTRILLVQDELLVALSLREALSQFPSDYELTIRPKPFDAAALVDLLRSLLTTGEHA